MKRKSFASLTFLSRRVLVSVVIFFAGTILALFAKANPRILPQELSSLTPSGTPQTAWVSIYDGPANDEDAATAIGIDESGNVYVTGRSIGTSYPDFDYVTIKYNSAGQQLWVARYDGPGNYADRATAIALDGMGNVYVTGESFNANGNTDYATIKYNSAGQQQWVARYNGPANADDSAVSIAVDSSGNAYVTGTIRNPGRVGDYATIKYDATGQQQWVAMYDGPGALDDSASALALDASGNTYVTGRSQGAGFDDDYATIKYNSAGQEQWVMRYGGPGYDEAKAIVLDGSDNVYVTGVDYAMGTLDDYATIKYNSAGEQQWAVRYNGGEGSDDTATALVVDLMGNVYVTGQSYGPESDYDYVTVKYDSAGQERWVARYGGPAQLGDYPTAIAVDTAGNVYVSGLSRNAFDYDYATIKYSPAGQQRWVARFNGAGFDNDEASAIAVDQSGNVYVTGMSTGPGRTFDCATIKYEQGSTPSPTPTVTPSPTSTPTPSPTVTPTTSPTPTATPRVTPRSRPIPHNRPTPP